MKNILFISTLILSIFDYPLVAGIVTFLPFLALAIWIAVRFWPKEYVIMWKLVIRGLLQR